MAPLAASLRALGRLGACIESILASIKIKMSDSIVEHAPMIRPTPRAPSLREHVLTTLRAAIITAQMEPDRIYSVGELAETLAVSRSPVREAILELAQEGLVTVIRNRGFMINELSQTDLKEIFQLRLILEVSAAGLLAQAQRSGNLTRAFFRDCRQDAQRIVGAAEDEDLTAFLEADRRFHARLVSGIDNLRLSEIVRVLRDQTRLVGLRNLPRDALMSSALEHIEILDVIEQGSATDAKRLASKHVRHTQGVWAGREES